MRLGITDYLLKPVKYEDLLSAVRRALAQNARRPKKPQPTGGEVSRTHFPEIVGESAPMQELFEIIERVAETDTNILLTGESGTGKEVVASAIHRS